MSRAQKLKFFRGACDIKIGNEYESYLENIPIAVTMWEAKILIRRCKNKVTTLPMYLNPNPYIFSPRNLVFLIRNISYSALYISAAWALPLFFIFITVSHKPKNFHKTSCRRSNLDGLKITRFAFRIILQHYFLFSTLYLYICIHV